MGENVDLIIQYINIFFQALLAAMLGISIYVTDKQLKQSREETEELKKQVSVLLQKQL